MASGPGCDCSRGWGGAGVQRVSRKADLGGPQLLPGSLTLVGGRSRPRSAPPAGRPLRSRSGLCRPPAPTPRLAPNVDEDGLRCFIKAHTRDS